MLAKIDQLFQLPFLAQGEEGPGRSYWFIALLIIFAIQHLAEKLKAKREANEELSRRARGSDSDDEEEWEDDEPGGYQAPVPTGETLAEFFRTLTQQQEQPPVTLPPPRTPPVAPVVESPPARVARKKPLPPSLSAAEQRALEVLKKSGKQSNLIHGRTRRQRMHSSSSHSALGRMLSTPSDLRNAFILKEVLDPPIASREDTDPHRSK
jgi:hypothetical protein